MRSVLVLEEEWTVIHALSLGWDMFWLKLSCALQYLLDFSGLTRRQRIIQRNRTERLSELLDWKNLGIVRIFGRRWLIMQCIIKIVLNSLVFPSFSWNYIPLFLMSLK